MKLKTIAGVETEYCAACKPGYNPSGYANLAVPLERLFLTCTEETRNPWGKNCHYTGMSATNT